MTGKRGEQDESNWFCQLHGRWKCHHCLMMLFEGTDVVDQDKLESIKRSEEEE